MRFLIVAMLTFGVVFWQYADGVMINQEADADNQAECLYRFWFSLSDEFLVRFSGLSNAAKEDFAVVESAYTTLCKTRQTTCPELRGLLESYIKECNTPDMTGSKCVGEKCTFYEYVDKSTSTDPFRVQVKTKFYEIFIAKQAKSGCGQWLSTNKGHSALAIRAMADNKDLMERLLAAEIQRELSKPK